jgi:DNA-binding IclR family transcriptional regulator
MPFLQDLYERTHETVHLGVNDGPEVVYIAKIGGHRQASSPSRAGGRMPLHCTAIGKALLAHGDPALRQQVLSGPLTRLTPRTIVAPGLLRTQLRKVVETGVAFEHEESQHGINCVAAPVFEGAELIAAISITGPINRFRADGQANAVRGAAAAVGATLTRRRQAAHAHAAIAHRGPQRRLDSPS